MSTGQGILGNNMYAYCGNNPVMYVDPTGQFLAEIWEAFKEAFLEYLPAYGTCASIAAVDGPLPFGDIIALAGALLITVGVMENGSYQVAHAPDISIPKVEEKEKVIYAPLPPDTVIYRHHGTNPGNLTPSKRDIEMYPKTGKGLSFSTEPEYGSAMTTVGAIQSTGFLFAIQDGPTHISVFPKNATLMDWYLAGSTSIWTKALQSVVVKYKGE